MDPLKLFRRRKRTETEELEMRYAALLEAAFRASSENAAEAEALAAEAAEVADRLSRIRGATA